MSVEHQVADNCKPANRGLMRRNSSFEIDPPKIEGYEQKLSKFGSFKNIPKPQTSTEERPKTDKGEILKVYSPIIKVPKTWSEMSLLVPHEVIRRGLEILLELVDEKYINANSEPWKFQTLKKWFKNHLLYIIQKHHTNEEEVYFPWIHEKIDKISEYSGSRAKFTAFHTEFIQILASMEQAQDIVEFRKLAIKLSDHKTKNLNDEELFYPEVLEKHFTKEEHAEVVGKIIQGMGNAGNKVFLPWFIDVMYEWAGTEVADGFYNN